MVTDEMTHSKHITHHNDNDNDPHTISSISELDDDNLTLENISIKSREVSLSDDTESITLSTEEHTKYTIEYDEYEEEDEEEEEEEEGVKKDETEQEKNQQQQKEEENLEEKEVIQKEGRDEREGKQDEEVEDDDDDEEDGRPSYKRMVLKGESESDKDLIIYSLNESLQIHKEIVERIQHEKDDLEEKYEQERIEEKLELQRETLEIEEKQTEKKQELSKLETIYQSLLNELEQKKQDYKRMESRFYSHVKSIRATEDDLSTIRPEINQLLSQINNLCMSIKSKLVDHSLATLAFFHLWPNKVDLIKAHIKSESSSSSADSDDSYELDSTVLSLMTEKMIIDIIVNDILNTPIHPGVPVNEAFGQIHAWVEKRNTSWAARMKQQISAFVIRQPTEEQGELETAKDEIVSKIMTQLVSVYPDLKDDDSNNKVKNKVIEIVGKAAKLNLSIKCQEIPIEILPIEEGAATFDDTLMKSVMQANPQDLVVLMVSPLFVAKDPADENSFVIPAKVYCA